MVVARHIDLSVQTTIKFVPENTSASTSIKNNDYGVYTPTTPVTGMSLQLNGEGNSSPDKVRC